MVLLLMTKTNSDVDEIKLISLLFDCFKLQRLNAEIANPTMNGFTNLSSMPTNPFAADTLNPK